MALPPDLPLVTVTFGPVIDFEGLPIKGSTTVNPNKTLLHLATGTPIVPRPITREWDVNGQVSFTLPATDAAGLNVTASGGWEYQFVHRTFDSSAPTPDPKLVKLPQATPSVDLDLLVPTTASNGIVVDQPAVTSVAGLTGAPTASQLVTAMQVPLGAAFVPVFTPEAYGATGDGTADDTAEVQAAITAAQAVRGTVLLGANRTYRITAPLVITAPMTLRGQGVYDLVGSFNQNGGILEMPVVAPYLAGSVIRQDTPATDVIRINGQGITVDLEDFGITFAAAIAAKNTGHGIKVTPQTLSGQSDRGLWGARWKNLKVHGCDGNHYSYWLLNPILSSFDHCYAYVGGGWYVACDSTSGNYGNLTFTDPYVCTGVGGTADAYHFEGAAATYPGLLNLIAMVRPQGIVGNYVPNFPGATPGSPSQRIFYANNVRWISLLQYDFETGVGSSCVYPTRDCWLDPAGLGPDLANKSTSMAPRSALISAVQPPNNGAPAFATIAQSSSMWGGAARYQGGTPAVNDNWTYAEVLDGGTYRIDFYGTKGPDHGTADLFMDGALIGSIDQYNASNQNNPLPSSFTGVAVKGPGRHELKLVVTGKNGSATSYYVAMSAVTFTRTGP